MRIRSALAAASFLVSWNACALPQLSGIQAVSAGLTHSCALTNSGAVKCWGTGFDGGLLGDGTKNPSPIPADVVGLSSGVTAISAGSHHTCALLSTGGVKCWGRPSDVGAGHGVSSLTPIDAPGLSSGVAAISAGHAHTCVLMTSGTVKCWGDNSAGQLGDGTTVYRSAPVDVVGLSNVTAVSAGNGYTCAVTSAGGAKCWGANFRGQLGNNSTTRSTAPVDVSGLSSGVTAISAGTQNTCAIAAGAVKCWGDNSHGEVGDGTTTPRIVPASVVGLGGTAVAIASGRGHTCALLSGGAVRCWGNDLSGQLGDGATSAAQATSPVTVVNLTATAIAAGYDHNCAVKPGGSVVCWGANESAQIGNNHRQFRTVPIDVPALSGIAAVAFKCALTAGGAVKCWGSNSSGEVGDGTNVTRAEPVDVVGLSSGVASISSSFGARCAVTTGGGLKCWGFNSTGAVGDGTLENRKTPVDVVGLSTGVAMADASVAHTCAVMTSGSVRCWGRNESGEVGFSRLAASRRLTPFEVPGLSGVTAVTTGLTHTCAITSAGGAKCWGSNTYGELGDGTTVQRDAHADVSGMASGVAAIAAGGSSTCALTTSGGVKCWGYNSGGGLGDGTTVHRSTPVDVAGLSSGVVAITDSCALTSAGAVKCWGGSDDTGLLRTTPVEVLGLQGGVAAISDGCALMIGGNVKCWGLSPVGDGSAAVQHEPVAVLAGVSADVRVTVAAPTVTPATGAAISTPATGRDLVYSIFPVALGPDYPPTNVTVTVPIPAGATYVWVSTDACNLASGTLTCRFGTAPIPESFRVVVRTSSAGAFTLTAAVSSAQSDPDPANNTGASTNSIAASPVGQPVLRYRLYSPVTLEHHFTTDKNEYDTLGTYSGTWQQEGTVGKVLDNPGAFGGVTAVPYYRIYDTSKRWHHWTTDPNEYYTLKQFVWFSAEGVDGFILPTQASGSIPLYRLLYPQVAGLHHWTIDAYEYGVLTTQYGWIGEGGSGFVLP